MSGSVGVLSDLLLLALDIAGLGVSLLNQGELESLSLGEGDGGGLAVSDDLDVGDSSGEGVAVGVLDVHDVVGSGVLLDGLEDSNSSDVVSSVDEHGGSVVELDDSAHLLGLEVELKDDRV